MFNPQLFFLFAVVCQCVFAANGDAWSARSDAQKLRQLKKNTKVTRSPCTCNEDAATCTCCATFAGEKGCASFKIPDGKNRNNLVRYNFNFNDQSTTMMSPAGVDPPPLCLTILGGWVAEACAVFDGTLVNEQYFRACVVIKATVAFSLTLEADLNCADIYINYNDNYNDYNYNYDGPYGPILVGNEKKKSQQKRSEKVHPKHSKSGPC